MRLLRSKRTDIVVADDAHGGESARVLADEAPDDTPSPVATPTLATTGSAPATSPKAAPSGPEPIGSTPSGRASIPREALLLALAQAANAPDATPPSKPARTPAFAGAPAPPESSPRSSEADALLQASPSALVAPPAALPLRPEETEWSPRTLVPRPEPLPAPVQAPAAEPLPVPAAAPLAPPVPVASPEASPATGPDVTGPEVAATPIHWRAPGAMAPLALLRVEPTPTNGSGVTTTADSETADAGSDEAQPVTRTDTPTDADTDSDETDAPSFPPADPSRLGEMLVARGLITREQLDMALAEQIVSGLRLGSQLVALGTLEERQLVETLAEQLGLDVVDLRLTTPDPEAIASFPEALARRYEVVPLRRTEAGLELAVAEALNGNRAALEQGAGGPIVAVLAPPSEIQYAIDQAYVALDGVEQQVRAFEVFASSRAPVEQGTELVVDEQAPVVQVVTLLLTQAMRDRASDVHIEPQDGSVRVRFRIDGVLRNVTTVPDSMAQALISRIKVMADMNIVERRRPQDGQIAMTIDERPVDIRVATTSTIWGEKAVLRILDKTRSLRSLGELGMSQQTSTDFRELVTSPFGMVLCVGPTGSGKTTTLYAALSEINSPERNITTIEDPVEYVLPSINQIQVNAQAGITFADGLKSILRQDPDVILVGEIRDVETASIAVQSALTGHFVLSSLHATDAATALQRFRDMGIEPFLLTSSVLAVEAQRLVRRICSHCKQPYEPTPAERAFFNQHAKRPKHEFWAGVGCNLCAHTGYSGRVGIYELLRITEAIKQLVMADASYDDLRALAVEEGMRTLRDEAFRLIEEDVTTIAEAVRSVYVR